MLNSMHEKKMMRQRVGTFIRNLVTKKIEEKPAQLLYNLQSSHHTQHTSPDKNKSETETTIAQTQTDPKPLHVLSSEKQTCQQSSTENSIASRTSHMRKYHLVCVFLKLALELDFERTLDILIDLAGHSFADGISEESILDMHSSMQDDPVSDSTQEVKRITRKKPPDLHSQTESTINNELAEPISPDHHFKKRRQRKLCYCCRAKGHLVKNCPSLAQPALNVKFKMEPPQIN